MNCLPSAPAPTHSPNSVNNPPSLKGPSDFVDTVESTFGPSQDVNPASTLSHSSPSVGHLEPTAKGRETPSKPYISPVPVGHRCCDSAMAGQRLPLRPYARETLTYDFPPTTTRPFCVDSLDDIASSRPIPLSALSSRANSRNKGSKAWKPLQLDDDDDDPKDHVNSISNADASQYDHRSQLPAQRHSRGDDSSFRRYEGSRTTRPRFHALERSSEETDDSMGRPWMKNVQRNPLSCSNGYEFPSESSFSQYQGYISEGPFLKTDNYAHLEFPGWIANGCQVPSGRSSGGIQSHYRLLFSGEKPTVPENSSSSHAYRYGPSNPYIAYTEPPQQQRPHSQMTISPPASMMGYSLQESRLEHGDDYSRLAPEYVCSNAHGRTLPGPTVGRAFQTQISNPSLAQALNTVHLSKSAETNLNPDTVNPFRYPKVNDSRDKVAAYLKRVVQASEMSIKPTPLSDPFVDIGNPLREEYQEQMHTADSKQSLRASNDDPVRVSEEISSITRKLSAANEAFKLLCDASIPEKKNPSVHQGDEVYESLGKSETRSSKAADKTLRPPPGLASNAPARETERSSFCRRPKAENAALEEANRWFHTDNRGEEQLREQVTDIAQAHAEDCKILQGPTGVVSEVETAKQTTLLLGNVIANLQSYVSGDRKEQTQNFANFSSVPDHFCEATGHGSHRSYFERDQSVEQLRIPTDISFPAYGERSEKRLVLSGFRRFPVSDTWDVLGKGV